ncbi:MAG TPA: Maf family protein [Rhabdaerophilum sp.]|nr:Maf family protein [Rhabdaerophilum sp.]
MANQLLAEKACPRKVACALARAKGLEASRRWPDAIILAADQTLETGGRLGMKPANSGEARIQFLAMRGRTHHLHSAACLLHEGRILWEGSATAEMTMRAFSDRFLDIYLARMGERVCQTVGAYEFEALGAHLFEKTEGDHATILGLPLQPLLASMRRLGLVLS